MVKFSNGKWIRCALAHNIQIYTYVLVYQTIRVVYSIFYLLVCVCVCVCVLCTYIYNIHITLSTHFRAPNAIIGILACAYTLYASTQAPFALTTFVNSIFRLLVDSIVWLDLPNEFNTWICNVPETNTIIQKKIKTKVTIRNSNKELISHRMYSFNYRWFFFVSLYFVYLNACFRISEKNPTLIVSFLLCCTVGWWRATFLKKKLYSIELLFNSCV